MAQLATAPSLGSLTAVGAQTQALARMEALAGSAEAAIARKKSNGVLRRAIKAWKRGDVTRAGQLSLEATNVDPKNAQAFHILGMALEKMGHLHKALVTYEHAYELDPEDPELLINLGLTAWNLKMTDGAAKMFRLFIAACPDSPLGYNNLGSIQCDIGQQTTAIETLRAALLRMPTETILWNSLATVLAEVGRADESLIFYQEAIRLDPDFSRPYHNLGYAFQHLGRLDEALESYDQALERAVDQTEKREGKHSRSICLIGMGRLEEGFREYEIRNDQYFRSYVHHMTKAPVWKGEPLGGKRLLIVGEQGLGDEFMFANILPDLQQAVGSSGKLQIAVDARLVSLFERSFPNADVGAYDDRKLANPDGNKELRFIPWATKECDPDFYATMGTALQYYRTRIENFPHQAFLMADPGRTTGFRKQLQALGKGPYVGICWRSMVMGQKRGKYYSPLDSWGPILKTPGVTFVNLQYGDCHEEIARAEQRHGIKIHVIDNLDLKNDIDGAAALSEAVDLVISAPTAAAAVAGAIGKEVWFLTAGRTWPQLGTEEFPWYRRTRVFSPEKFADWTELMPRVGEALAGFAIAG
jgi:tetratricopeptide (TPR) repeat protein